MASKGITPLGKHARCASTASFLKYVGFANGARAHRNLAWLAIVILLVLSSGPASVQADAEQANIQPQRLQCEFRTDPQGIDATQPRLNWVLECAESKTEIRGVKPTAYEVLVSSSLKLLNEDKGDLWNSGKVPCRHLVPRGLLGAATTVLAAVLLEGTGVGPERTPIELERTGFLDDGPIEQRGLEKRQMDWHERSGAGAGRDRKTNGLPSPCGTTISPRVRCPRTRSVRPRSR